MNKSKAVWIFAFTIIGLGVSICAHRTISLTVMSKYWREQLAVVPDNRVEIAVDQIAALDKTGIAILVEALGSDRPCVAQAAKQKLLDQINLWQKLMGTQCAERVTILADALSEQMENFKLAGQKHAVDVAVEILKYPLIDNGTKCDRALASIEKIVRTRFTVQVETPDAAPKTLAQLAYMQNQDRMTNSASPGFFQPEANAQPLQRLPAVSKNQLADTAVFLTTESGEEYLPDSQPNQPLLLGQRQSSGPAQAACISPTGEKSPTRPSEARPASNAQSEAKDQKAASVFANEDTVNLMHDLNSTDDSKAAAAEAELTRRGFSIIQIELSRRMFDPDPAVRKTLVERLPGCRGVDPVPWLLFLCQDADTDVRQTALTLLATSTNPAVLNEVEQIALRDADENIRQLGSRISQQINAAH